MRSLLTIILLMLLAGVGLIALVENEPGYVLVSYGTWTLETSLWIGLALLALLCAGVYLGLRFLLRLRSMRGVLTDWWSNRAYSRMLANCQMQLDDGQYQAVIDTLDTLEKLHDQELRLKARALAGQENWDEFLDLLPRLRKRKVFGEQRLGSFEVQAWLGRLNAATDDELQAAWNAVPSALRKQVPLLECYVGRMLDAGEDQEVEKLLTRSLKADLDERLLDLFGRMPGRNPARRLKLAERWLKDHPDDPALLLCLGRLSLHNERWEQAREYFESSHLAQPNAQACAENARLLYSMGEHELSARYFREGLLLRESGLPKLPQPRQDAPAALPAAS